MNYVLWMTRLGAAVLALSACSVQAAVTPEEAAALGQNLTLVGAEAAGNKDGTIPAYEGGLTTPPPEYKPGSGLFPDPFKGERPRLTITSKNMEQYADKLTEAQKYMLTRYPGFRMDIYPTHRTAPFPKHVLDATVKNATTSKTENNGLSANIGQLGGLPFPIAKNGHEMMWNHLLHYYADSAKFRMVTWYGSTTGRNVMNANCWMRLEQPYYQPKNPERDNIYFKGVTDCFAPGALAGQTFMYWDPLDFARKDRRAWMYIPGQRRVKLAPEFSYDTPHPGGAGMVTFDDISIFSGKMDRYSFKLVGKKEVYLPYNMYKFYAVHQDGSGTGGMTATGSPKHINPDYVRWELHRVWVVEADLLPGKRHIYKKRVFYWDEDGYGAGMSDEYDHAGKIFRASLALPIVVYDKELHFTFPFVTYDFSAGSYVVSGMVDGPLYAGLTGPGSAKPWTRAEWAPEAITGRVSR